MKLIFSAPNTASVRLLKDALESHGIACLTRNEAVSLIAGSVPFLECQPELWILHDDQWERAQQLLQVWNQDEFESWICPRCGEANDGQFAACWKCEFLIDAA